MIESALVFALGALTTAILAIVVMPAFTRRAARLARRDLELRLPRTLDEIAALRDGVRAEYAARTARVQAALEAANQSLVAERLTKADMAVQLSALRSERRAYQATMSEAEDRITAAFADLREREESLARAAMEKRELERQLTRLSEKLAEAEARTVEGERWANGMFPSPVSAESSAPEGPAAPMGMAPAPVFPELVPSPPPPFVTDRPLVPTPSAEERLARLINRPPAKVASILAKQADEMSPAAFSIVDATQTPADGPPVVAERSDITAAVELISKVEANTEPVELAAEPVELAAEPVELAAEPVELAAEPVELAAEPVELAAEPVELAAEPVELAAEPVELAAEPVAFVAAPEAKKAEPEPVKAPEPQRTVASLPPKMAAAIAEQLKAARARPLGQSLPAGPETAMALPPVAPWSVSLTPPLDDPPAEERPPPRPTRSRQPVARLARTKEKAQEPAPVPDPRREPPLWSATTEPKAKPAPRARAAKPSMEEVTPPAKRAEQKSRSWNLDADGIPIGSSDMSSTERQPLAEGNAGDAFAPRPVPVVRRPLGEDAAVAAAIQQAASPGAVPDAAFDPIANLPPRANEAFDPIANLPPRGSDTISFAPIATPTESPDLELAEEERSRRVDSLAERLRALRRRGASQEPPVKTSSS